MQTFPRLAIVPAAGLGTRFLPATKKIAKELIPVVNIPGIHMVATEAAGAGAKELAIIVSKDKKDVVEYFDSNLALEKMLSSRNKNSILADLKDISNIIAIKSIYQMEALGLGHAVLQAKKLLLPEDKAVSVILPDDLILPVGFFNEMQKTWDKYGGTVLCAFPVDKKNVSSYGIFEVEDTDIDDVKKVTGMVEKPLVDEAPSNLAAAGRYILDRKIFEKLEQIKPGVGGELQLTDAIDLLIEEGEPVHLVVHHGLRHDIGNPLGFIKASVDFALKDQEYKDDLRQWLDSRLTNENEDD